MIGKPIGRQEAGVLGGFARKIGFVAGLGLAVWAVIPVQARAQVNIDQGKSPADIFANDCGVCHKSTRGLANGENSLTLSSFLREHYTASKEQANALAAYVLANGGGSGAPQKPVAATEPKSSEPKGTKSSESKSSEAKPSETKPSDSKAAGAKPAAHPTRAAARGEEEASPSARPPHPAEEHDVQPATASRTAKPDSEPTPPVQQPAAIGAVPAANEAPGAASAPSQEAPTTSAAVPSEPQSGDGATVPRDDIPD
jgi:mono/diheme cytochrome c family protein